MKVGIGGKIFGESFIYYIKICVNFMRKKMYTFENLIDNDAVLLPERKKFREIKLPQAQDIDHHIIIDMFTTESRNFMSKCQSFKRLVIIGLL